MKTAKEFDKDFWNENNPLSTPLWKCAEAYAKYYHKEQLILLQSSLLLNNSLKECDSVWYDYEKYKIIAVDYAKKVASIKSDDGFKFCYNISLKQLTKIVL
jgi:hypothetical protein